jgi:flagellar hook-length control protein FliK
MAVQTAPAQTRDFIANMAIADGNRTTALAAKTPGNDGISGRESFDRLLDGARLAKSLYAAEYGVSEDTSGAAAEIEKFAEGLSDEDLSLLIAPISKRAERIRDFADALDAEIQEGDVRGVLEFAGRAVEKASRFDPDLILGGDFTSGKLHRLIEEFLNKFRLEQGAEEAQPETPEPPEIPETPAQAKIVLPQDMENGENWEGWENWEEIPSTVVVVPAVPSPAETLEIPGEPLIPGLPEEDSEKNAAGSAENEEDGASASVKDGEGETALKKPSLAPSVLKEEKIERQISGVKSVNLGYSSEEIPGESLIPGSPEEDSEEYAAGSADDEDETAPAAAEVMSERAAIIAAFAEAIEMSEVRQRTSEQGAAEDQSEALRPAAKDEIGELGTKKPGPASSVLKEWKIERQASGVKNANIEDGSEEVPGGSLIPGLPEKDSEEYAAGSADDEDETAPAAAEAMSERTAVIAAFSEVPQPASAKDGEGETALKKPSFASSVLKEGKIERQASGVKSANLEDGSELKSTAFAGELASAMRAKPGTSGTDETANAPRTPMMTLPGSTYELGGESPLGDGMRSVLEFMKNDGINEARIVVEPPSLGRVDVSLQASGAGVEAVFKVDNEALKQILQQQLDLLKTSLEAQGIHVSNLAVDIKNRDDQKGRPDLYGNRGKTRRADGIADIGGEDEPRLVRIDLEKGLLHWVA